MTDWRTNPRQGRSQFLPLLGDINKRLALGETIKMIFDSYSEIAMSYSQFTRYIKKYCNNEIRTKKDNTDKNATVPSNYQKEGVVSDSKQRIRNPADLRKLINKGVNLEELKNFKGVDNDSSNS